jgi:hypothetical protein
MKNYDEIMTAIKDEVKKTISFLVDMDIMIYGKVSKGTLKALREQGYSLNGDRKLVEV